MYKTYSQLVKCRRNFREHFAISVYIYIVNFIGDKLNQSQTARVQTPNMIANCFFKKRSLPCCDVMDFLNIQDGG